MLGLTSWGLGVRGYGLGLGLGVGSYMLGKVTGWGLWVTGWGRLRFGVRGFGFGRWVLGLEFRVRVGKITSHFIGKPSRA